MPSSAMRVAGPPVLGLVLAVLAVIVSVRRRLRTGGPSSGLMQVVLQGWNGLPEEVRKYIAGTLFVSLPIAIVGSLGGAAYWFSSQIMDRCRYFLNKHCQVTVLFNNSDKHYNSIVDYIGTKCHVETGKITASTKPRTRPSFQDMLAHWLGGKTKAPTLYYQPDLQAFADWFIWTDVDGTNHKIWLSRHVEKAQIRSNDSKQEDPETLSLTMWWTTDNSVLKDFLQVALKTMIKDDSGTTVDIYVKHMWLAMWTKAISREKRDRDTVILDGGQADFVVDDMKHFFSQKTADWYHNAGIPYRRGYLLYGPPGCGKTSFAQVLAGELNLDVCLMNLSNSDMNDDDLAELLRAAPAKSMLLLEDVDAIFVERAAGAEKKGRGGGISFSGLLNALDGAAAQEGCVIMMTTNHKERLDEALVRPGRCDVHVRVEKASKDQSKRMFWRFFAKEPIVKSCGAGGVITTNGPHRLVTGDCVSYKVGVGSTLIANNKAVENDTTFYVRNVDATQLSLYHTESGALNGGQLGLLEATEGKGVKLQELAEAGVRFSNRIPEKQVSMAKLQGYLMKQKLLAERDIGKSRDRDGMASEAQSLGIDQEILFREEVHRQASESAVMNVHELLDVKQEAEETIVSIYDHFRRIGLHRFAAIFEFYGVRRKQDITKELAKRSEAWEPDLKVESPQRQRLLKLLSGDSADRSSLDAAYDYADLSVLRDRFLSVYQKAEGAGALAEANSAKAVAPPPQPLLLQRAETDPTAGKKVAPTRALLLRSTSGIREDRGLKLLEMAHQFQERLETNGKTDVSMWQLDVHFERYADDPAGALENCKQLRLPSAHRSPKERQVRWTTTFGFLRRIGLESYGFTLEDNGYKTWSQLKDLTKDELKEKGEMSPADAGICHAVLSNSEQRPDLLRKFQIPEFTDIVAFFRARFPEANLSEARHFALQLTDELGIADFSCHQIEAYLKEAKGPKEAAANLDESLPSLEKAEAARKRPESGPAPADPTCWVYTWLKSKKMEEHAPAFIGQALEARDDVLAAPLDHKPLEDMGIKKIGDRCRILRYIEEERSNACPDDKTSQTATSSKVEGDQHDKEKKVEHTGASKGEVDKKESGGKRSGGKS